MYILNKISPEFEEVNNRSKEIVEKISAALTIKRDTVWIPVNQALEMSDEESKRKNVYFIKQGVLQCCRGNQLLFFLDVNDLIGLGGHFIKSGIRVVADAPVIADAFSREELMEALATDSTLARLWVEYTSYQLDLYSLYLATVITHETPTRPDVRSYSSGQVIIEQGSVAREVYALIDGHAEVFVDGVKVGAIFMDEIFGAIAALTETPRTASVVAATNCPVQVLPRDNFMQLMGTRPKTVLKMVEDMARVTVSLNHKVVELQKIFSSTPANLKVVS